MASKEQARIALNGLIRKYEGLKSNKEFSSNESQVSESLIKPFVKLVLGWDTSDFSEFKVESRVRGKRSDMLVCLNGITQFVIEAKSLAQDINGNTEFIKQAINYANSKDKPFAILTNFRYFIIIRCDIKVDNPLKAVVKTINIEKEDFDFDLLYNFSKEIWVDKGEENPLFKLYGDYKKRTKVDVRLLENLKEWRQAVINNIKKHPKHNKFDFSDEKAKENIEQEIQRLLDRLIFICYTEDKEFVDASLKPLLEEKKDRHYESPSWLLGKIRDLFALYWKNYNSDLFKPGDCDNFFIEDGVLADILRDLRAPKEELPYDFASIEADILGKTYENFIGHVIAGEKRLREKESKGKRKEMGIYYTPTYIVDYIVRNTLGEYIKGKAFSNINKVKVLDPACGSGSFLIRAFDVLVEESRKALGRELNYEEKKGLMLNCIHGVDLDERAVDICKLNLSLKLAERGQKLPELHDNIKCGNSLIDDKEIAGYKAFKWNEEFKSIMDNGGFDVVVGNPPYGADFKENETNELLKKYSTNLGKMNSYRLFIERSIKILNNYGVLGFIVPNTWLSDNDSTLLRKMILTQTQLLKLLLLPESLRVFEGVTQATTVIVLRKGNLNEINNNLVICMDNVTSKENFDKFVTGKIKQNIFFDLNDYKILTKESIIKVVQKIKKNGTEHLNKFFNINQGEVNLTIYKKYLRNSKEPNSRLLIRGNNISRYSINTLDNKKEGFILFSHLKRDDSDKKRIVLQEVSNMGQKRRLKASYLDFSANLGHTCNYTYFNNSSRNEKDILYFLGLLNSKLLDFYFKTFSNTNHVSGKELRQLPIKDDEQSVKQDIINLVNKMLSLSKKLQEIGDKNTLEKQKIQQEIQKTDNEIDELIYQLYGITEEEKKIIEESLK